MQRTAVITGITGADGSHLAELLLSKGYKVYGTTRRTNRDLGCSSHLKDQIEVLELDLSHPIEIYNVCKTIKPDEFYNMGAICSVYKAFEDPIQAAEVTGVGVLHCLQAIKLHSPTTHFLQASSSLIYGKGPGDRMIDELTPYSPTNPYGTAKLFSHFTTKNYRENFKLFACNAILFNHNSWRHNSDWVLQKIAQGVSRIKKGSSEKIRLGNLNSVRSWGHAEDFVMGMWLMLNHPVPDDYILAVSEPYTLGEICKIAFEYIGIDNWMSHVEADPQCFSSSEVDYAIGNASKAKIILGWNPRYTSENVIRQMIDHI